MPVQCADHFARVARYAPLAQVSPVRAHPVAGCLLDVMHQTVQMPLRIGLLAPSLRKAVHSLVVPDVAKYRLYRADALAIQVSVLFAVDGPLHQLGGLVGARLAFGEDGHLAHLGALRAAQA